MASGRDVRRGILLLVLLAVTSGVSGSQTAPASSSEGQQSAKVLSVRKVLRTPYFTSRYPQIHYYELHFAVRTADQTYCSEYETPVLDEIDDLISAKNQDVEIVVKGKNLTLKTPTGRKIKAHLVEPGQC